MSSGQTTGQAATMPPDWAAELQQQPRFEALRAQLGFPPDALEDTPAPSASAAADAFKHLTPGTLAVMTPEDWSAHLMEHGRTHVESMLQQAPATFTDPALCHCTHLLARI